MATHPCARRVVFPYTVTASDNGTIGFAAYSTSLMNRVNHKRVRRNRSACTDVHLCLGIVLIPSMSRSCDTSEKLISGVKTAQSTCAHPCPSVGLEARKNESALEYCTFFLDFRRGQSKQSVF